MIPLLLEVKNFLSFGEPTTKIDFSGYDLICFSGKNGHGKSAIFDAMTWALWGQARKISGVGKPDLGLLKVGKKLLLVILEFEVDGQRYRVRREFSHPYSRAVATLDFYVFDPEKGQFQDLTDKTIRATQAKIIQILGIDYETFSSSCFFRQGHSNQFSTKTPRERKNILAKILGLDVYDTMQQEAADQSRKFLQKVASQEFLLSQVSGELQQETELLSQQSLSENRLKKLQEAILQMQDKLQILGNDIAQMTAILATKKDLALEITKVENEKKMVQERFVGVAKQWRALFAQALSQQGLEALVQKREKFVQNLSIQEKRSQEVFALEKKVFALQQQAEARKVVLFDQYQAEEKKITATKVKVEQDFFVQKSKKEVLVKNLKDFKAEKQKLTLDLQHLEQSIARLQNVQEKAEAQRLFLVKGKSFYKKMQERGLFLTKQLKQLQEREISLAGDVCPLCVQQVTAQCKAQLFEQTYLQQQVFEHQRQRILRFLPELKDRVVRAKEYLTVVEVNENQLKKDLLQKNILANKLTVLEKQQQSWTQEMVVLEQDLALTVQKVTGVADQLKASFSHYKGVLAKDLMLSNLAKQMFDFQRQITEASYDKDLFAHLKKDLSAVEHQIAILEQASIKKELLQEAKVQRSLIFRHFQEIKLRHKSLQEKLLPLVDQEAKLKVLQDQERKLQALFKEHDEERISVSSQLGAVKSKLERLEQLKQKVKTIESEIVLLNSEVDILKKLEVAFGSNGLQALLIEDVIPELEDEANKILKTISQTQACVFIESLRDLKKGGTRESLDIKIADMSGIRDYEMFSGGEAFRIDFALRVAISKIIARRAGRKLETLIIDEGFGALDQEGMQVLVESIYRVMSDFRKIIIVTHLSELKEMFPVHFSVQKQRDSSVVTVQMKG